MPAVGMPAVQSALTSSSSAPGGSVTLRLIAPYRISLWLFVTSFSERSGWTVRTPSLMKTSMSSGGPYR